MWACVTQWYKLSVCVCVMCPQSVTLGQGSVEEITYTGQRVAFG